MTTNAEPATLTPPEVDRELARIHGQSARILARIADTRDALHHALGERRPIRGASWPTSDREAEVKAREATKDPEATGFRVSQQRSALADLDRYRAQYDDLIREQAPYSREWVTRQWSRFFLVPGGHIHSSMDCHTTRPTTVFTWLPDLSGQTEAEAVAAHGPLLCSVCFPTAPVEWTTGPVKPADPDECPGSREHAVQGTYNPRQVSPRGRCPECGQNVSVTSTGRTRKHKSK